MSSQEQATAIMAAVDAEFTTPRAVDFKGAKAKTADHVIVSVSRRFVPDQLVSGEVAVKGGRVMTRYVGKGDVNVYAMRDRVREALEDVALTAGAETIGPFVFEAEEAPGPDGPDWFSGADFWTF